MIFVSTLIENKYLLKAFVYLIDGECSGKSLELDCPSHKPHPLFV